MLPDRLAAAAGDGFITYIRTDAVNIEKDALLQIRDAAGALFGSDHLSSEPRTYKCISTSALEYLSPSSGSLHSPSIAKRLFLEPSRPMTHRLAHSLLGPDGLPVRPSPRNTDSSCLPSRRHIASRVGSTAWVSVAGNLQGRCLVLCRSKAKNAQEAHEAIRPTDPLRRPEQLPASVDPQARQLYNLIWRRTLACQMADSKTRQVPSLLGHHPVMLPNP